MAVKEPFARPHPQVGIVQGAALGMHAGGKRPPPLPRGDYADSFLPLNDQVREFERDPANRYTYCVRATATYECLSYGTDGEIRRQQSRAISHGTAFAYREQGGETMLLTNAHVTTWPRVTDSRNAVNDVPAGCKLITESLQIVDNEMDDFGADDLQLTRVSVYEEFDAAIVKTRAKLRIIPYRVGKSAALKAGDVVLVRGFPLGAFQAYNTGKVVNPYDLDTYKEWGHIDFIIDAPLSSGNSGSPVLALSSRTGEYELVGLFHASYARANSLNAVVGIDQLREFMVQLKRPQGVGSAEGPRGTARRAELEQALAEPSFVPYLSLGPLTISLRAFGKNFLFEVFSRRFPLDDQRVLLLLDQPGAEGAGAPLRLWFGNERGYKAQEPAALGPDEQRRLQHALSRLHGLAATTVRFRMLTKKAAAGGREAVSERTGLQRTITRESSGDSEVAQLLVELAERLGPHPADEAVSYISVIAALAAPPPPAPAIALTPPSETKEAPMPASVPASSNPQIPKPKLPSQGGSL